MFGTDRSETQVLEVSDVNSDRTELVDLNELDKRPNRTDSHTLNYRTNRSKDCYGSDCSGHRTASLRHRTALDRYDRSRHSPRLAIEENRHRRSIIPLRHAELGELSPASRLKQKRQRSSSDYSASPSCSRSPSLPRRKSKKKLDKKKKRKCSLSLYSSSSCHSSSSSRERHKHRHKSKKKKSRNSRSHKSDSNAKKRKRRSSPSASTSSRSSPVQDTISIHAPDDFFSQDEGQQDDQSIDDPSLDNDEERVDFATFIDKVYNQIPSDRFPRMTTVSKLKTKSSIQKELQKDSPKNVSVPQSECTKAAFDCVKSALGSKPHKDGNYPDPVSII